MLTNPQGLHQLGFAVCSIPFGGVCCHWDRVHSLWFQNTQNQLLWGKHNTPSCSAKSFIQFSLIQWLADLIWYDQFTASTNQLLTIIGVTTIGKRFMLHFLKWGALRALWAKLEQAPCGCMPPPTSIVSIYIHFFFRIIWGYWPLSTWQLVSIFRNSLKADLRYHVQETKNMICETTVTLIFAPWSPNSNQFIHFSNWTSDPYWKKLP